MPSIAPKSKILYIDDNHTNLVLLREMFMDQFDVFITSSVDTALSEVKSGKYKLVLVDYLMPELTGIEFITKAYKFNSDSLYIILTAHASLQVAISAINHGNVYRFMEKPWNENELGRAIQSAVELYDLRLKNQKLLEDISKKNKELTKLKEQLEAENLYLQEEIISTTGFDEIISKDSSFKGVLKKVNQVASTRASVLILGETGTGKELIARAIHKSSNRSEKPFIKLNCSAIPESLIESELFGHVKGSFTGASDHKKGKFELAHKGTLFLDEIGELSTEMQPKLLRVLQEGELEKVGSQKPIHVDVRIIAATNKNLEEEMEKGHFRNDLYYRLNVFPITLPPLRERPRDIEVLVPHFLARFNRINNRNVKVVSKQTMEYLKAYHWPGNIRELENIIERAVIISNGSRLELMEESYSRKDSDNDQKDPAFSTLADVEKAYIEKVLKETNFRVSGERGAAKILGLNPTTLESRIKKLGITKG